MYGDNADLDAYFDYMKRSGLNAPSAALPQQVAQTQPPPGQKQPQQSPQSTDISPPPYPAPPNLRDMPQAPTAPQDNPFAVFKDPAIVLAGLGSLFTRHSLTTAFNSAAGAMEGYRAGQKDVFDQKKQAFDEAIKAATEQNKVELDKYNDAWNRRNQEVKDKFAALYAQAAGNNDTTLMAALKAGDSDIIEKIITAREAAQTKLSEAVQLAQIKQQIAQQAATAGMNPDTLDFMARQLIKCNTNVLVGLFRSPGAKMAVEEAARTILTQQNGMNDDQAAAFVTDQSNKLAGERRYQMTAGGYAARVESATNEVEQLVPQAIETSLALPRGQFVPLNQVVQAWQAGTSDPAFNDFVFANFSLMNAYARAMNPSGTALVNDKLETKALNILSTATSPEAYEKQVRRLWLEVQASKAAQAKTREGLSPAKPFPGGGPKPGDIEDGHRFKGGDPANPENWEPVH